jgi:cytochrome b561
METVRMRNARYTTTAIILHWLVALAILVNVSLAWSADYLPDADVRLVIDTHKSIGITVLGLATLRLLWRFSHPQPEFDPLNARWERRLARVVHGLLYVLLFALPLSGLEGCRDPSDVALWIDPMAQDSCHRNYRAYPQGSTAYAVW